jgi:hypothetical protein
MKYLLLSTLAALSIGWVGTSANAAPIYLGLQDGNGAIFQPALTAIPGGGFSFAIQQIGGSGVYASGTVEGTPPLPEPFLLSATTDLAGSHDPNGAVVSIYMTETNQFPTTFAGYSSHFASTIPLLVNNNPNTVKSVVESIYVHDCGGVPCNSGTDVFNLDKLVATATFTATGGVDAISPITHGLAWPYAVTEVYTVTFGPGGVTAYGSATNSISMSVPEPFSLALLGSALFGLGLVRRRRT